MSLSQSQADDDSGLLNQIQIAAPCHVDWESMTGDERKRFCGDCKLNVYNISSMSTKDAAKLIRQSEGRACLRLYRRKDGTVITDNCPIGLGNLRNRVLAKTAAVTALFALLGLASGTQAQGQVMMGAVAPSNYCRSILIHQPWSLAYFGKRNFYHWRSGAIFEEKSTPANNWFNVCIHLDLRWFCCRYFLRLQLLRFNSLRRK